MYQRHFGQGRLLFEVIELDHFGESLLVGDLQCAPRVFFGAGLGVEIMAFRVEGGRVRVGGFTDATNPGNPRLRATGVIKEEQVPYCHGSHKVARLVVAHAVPGGGGAGGEGGKIEGNKRELGKDTRKRS